MAVDAVVNPIEAGERADGGRMGKAIGPASTMNDGRVDSRRHCPSRSSGVPGLSISRRNVSFMVIRSVLAYGNGI